MVRAMKVYVVLHMSERAGLEEHRAFRDPADAFRRFTELKREHVRPPFDVQTPACLSMGMTLLSAADGHVVTAYPEDVE